jgi:hypothetical protein
MKTYQPENWFQTPLLPCHQHIRGGGVLSDETTKFSVRARGTPRAVKATVVKTGYNPKQRILQIRKRHEPQTAGKMIYCLTG